MKKFLSLVLALVMTMSLVTISAGAKDFTDDDKITYEEAVAVVSEIGVVDGYADGKFNPTNTLTRQAAAKIICNLILGPTTAAELHADTAPYKDVPATSEFAGYIAYCAKEGIISGYADGSFKPGNTLTGYAFMKMLLGALGYDQEIEGYVGGNWSINVAKQAINVGLNKGLKGEFNGIKAVTREEACLYAFNTLQADMVEYDTTISTTINGQTVTIGNSQAKAMTWKNSATRRNNIKADDYVQFAEQYFNKLVKTPDVDDFGRPAYTWTWKSEEIDTYVDYTTLVADYTEKVEYKDLYEAVGKLAADEYEMYAYIDGVDNDALAQSKITKSNDSTVPATGNGVLTQVFVDNDSKEFTVVEVNSWLGQAVSDYNKSTEELTLRIFNSIGGSIIRTVSADDFDIADYEKDDIVMVTMAGDDKDVKSVETPEVVSEVEISTYSVKTEDTGNNTQNQLDSVTAEGTKYSTAVKAFWDEDYLFNYNKQFEQLKDHKYNLYLDAYGYVLGLENVEDTTNYLFIVGYDIGSSVLAKTLDKALVIFPEGDMKTITCYEKDKDVHVVDQDNANVNEWWTYTVDEDGNYALKERVATQFHDLDTNRDLDIDLPTLKGVPAGQRSDVIAYGNAKSVYITVEADTDVVTGGSIVDVTNVTTGIKNTSIDMREKTTQNAYGAYVLYDGNYVKYAVVVGEDGSIGNRFVYLTTGIGERSWKSTPGYYWSYDAIIDGNLLETKNGEGGFNTLTEVNDNNAWLAGETLYKASYDKDGYAKKMELLNDNWDKAETSTNKDKGYVQITSAVSNKVTVPFTVTLRGQTMYFQAAEFSDRYVMLDDDCVFWVQNDEAKNDDFIRFDDVDAAMAATGVADLNGSDETYKISGRLVAICDKTTGFATSVIITDEVFENKGTSTPATTGYKVAPLQGQEIAVNASNTGLTLKNAKVVDNSGANKSFGDTATLTVKIEVFNKGWDELTTVEKTVSAGEGDQASVFAPAAGVEIPVALADGQYRVTITLSNKTIGTLAVYDNLVVVA